MTKITNVSGMSSTACHWAPVSATSLITATNTQCSGAQCGATHIDDFFLTEFLPSRLKREDRQRLLSHGGADTGHTGRSHHILKEEERLILERFQIIKHRFAGRGLEGGPEPLDDQLALPDSAGIADSERYKIRNGQLGITW